HDRTGGRRSRRDCQRREGRRTDRGERHRSARGRRQGHGEVTLMQWLAALCVKRPVFAWVLVLSLTVVGLFAFGQLGVDRFPNIDVPTISVTTRLPGAAPDPIETEATDKIEESVNTISAI